MSTFIVGSDSIFFPPGTELKGDVSLTERHVATLNNSINIIDGASDLHVREKYFQHFFAVTKKLYQNLHTEFEKIVGLHIDILRALLPCGKICFDCYLGLQS